MLVFKVKWIPYMCMIAGASFVYDGQVITGLAFAAVGAVLLYFMKKK